MQWYVLRSKPNQEEALWREVCARGHQTFYPRLNVKPINPRSRTVRPYFPGYLFVNADEPQIGSAIWSRLPHAQGLVSFGGEPAAVPEGMIHAIRRHVEEINSAGSDPLRGLERGDEVLIQAGPFTGHKAVFDARLSGSERVRVFLQFLAARFDRQMKLELPAGQVQKTKRR